MKGKKIIAGVTGLTAIQSVAAHCPLCTVGAAAAAGGAAYLGVNKGIIGIFIGAFAASMGWWISKLIKKNYIPFQRGVLVIFSYLTTVIPLLPLLGTQDPLYISFMGGYGSILNRTYLINLFLYGSIVGALIVCSTPFISNKLTEWRGEKMPYQMMGLTFILLLALSLIIQFVM